MRTKEIRVKINEFKNLDELTGNFKDLLIKSREIAKNAYAPYSGFFVGAAVLLEDGTIVTGNNQENAAYPSGLCAERVALFYANANYPDIPVTAIAVSAIGKNGQIPDLVSPCGSCRQVLLETESRFEKPVIVILDGNPIQLLEGVENLLPFGFRPHALK
ncbi:MAG: cytidine deaminase [Prolixibacteraceae bacterium]|nr:cytidine deaminase [Prolixibacteraceae bacterium]